MSNFCPSLVQNPGEVDPKLIMELSPLQWSFTNPNTGKPLVGYFHAYHAGTRVHKTIYVKLTDGEFYPAPNPMPLDGAGALEATLFPYPYKSDDVTVIEKYDYVIKDMQGVDILSFRDQPDIIASAGGSGASYVIEEHIVNGQFNFPWNFNVNEPGRVDLPITPVCPGWIYRTDANVSGTNPVNIKIQFREVLDSPVVEVPKYILDIDQRSFDESSQVSYLEQKIGSVEYLAGQRVTFGSQMQSLFGTSPSVTLSIVRNYGDASKGATETETISVGNFSPGAALATEITRFTIPSLEGKVIVGNQTSLTLVLSIPGDQPAAFGVTSVSLREGSYTTLPFDKTSYSHLKSLSTGDAMSLEPGGDAVQYSPLSWVNGSLTPVPDTARYIKVDKNAIPPNAEELLESDRKQLDVGKRNAAGIPYRRLFNVIGHVWGQGTLGMDVTKKSAAAVHFKFLTDGEPAGGYTDPGTGTAGTNQQNMLREGRFDLVASVSPLDTSGRTLRVQSKNNNETSYFFIDGNSNWTYEDNNQTFRYIMFTSTDRMYYVAGWHPLPKKISNTNMVKYAGTNDPFIVDFEFLSDNISEYATKSHTNVQITDVAYVNTMHWSRNSHLIPVNNWKTTNKPIPADTLNLSVSVDGNIDNVPWGTPPTIPEQIVEAFSSWSVQKLVQEFVNAINARVEYDVVFTKPPEASEYFLFASNTREYYAWWEIDGTGVDPALPGKEAIKVSGSANDTTEQAIDKFLDAIGSETFQIPSQQDIGGLSSGEADINTLCVTL